MRPVGNAASEKMPLIFLISFFSAARTALYCEPTAYSCAMTSCSVWFGFTDTIRLGASDGSAAKYSTAALLSKNSELADICTRYFRGDRVVGAIGVVSGAGTAAAGMLGMWKVY